MKRIFTYLILSIAAISAVSCNWLDIIPEDTTTEEQQFSDAGGYHSAINGLYQTMASPSLYGKNLTWGFVSALSQYYDNAVADNSKAFSYTEKYDYASDEVRSYGEEIWQTAYNVIANANNILRHLETADPAIFPEYDKHEVDVIRGESLAVRALMHFDLLRLFAVAPAVDAKAKAIPYVESYPSLFNERKTVSEVIAKVEKDLDEAASLLAENDTTTSLSAPYLYNTSSRYLVSNSSRDYFFTARGVRLNYVAVKALQARVAAYAGNLVKAASIADGIISKYVEGDEWYSYTTGFSASDQESSRPHKLIDELLISFYRENLATEYKSAANKDLDYNSYALKNVAGIFADNDDYRKVKLLSNLSTSTTVSLKYFERSGGSSIINTENRLLPVMRLSELYLLKAEYLASQNKIPEAVAILNDLRIKRGCMTTTIDPGISAAEFKAALDKEIWRENVAEGQYFFYCKRINAPSINNDGVFVPMEGKYTMEIPDSEINLN